MRDRTFQLWAAALAIAALAGCAHPVPALRGRDVMISGRNTAQDTVAAATRKVLSEAAAITLDHGYRYFEILGPIRPGAKVPVRLYLAGETAAAPPHIYDAMLIMLNQPKPREPSPEEGIIDR